MREVHMYFFRVVFAGAGLFSLLLLSTLGTGGCTGSLVKKRTFKIDCVTKITVDPSNGVASSHKAVYVCGGDTVTWDAKKGVTFTVHFPGACPFNPCPDITEAQASATVATQPVDLTVYKYTITVNGSNFDPHVVSGGGY
jgi:plastocyanin